MAEKKTFNYEREQASRENFEKVNSELKDKSYLSYEDEISFSNEREEARNKILGHNHNNKNERRVPLFVSGKKDVIKYGIENIAGNFALGNINKKNFDEAYAIKTFENFSEDEVHDYSSLTKMQYDISNYKEGKKIPLKSNYTVLESQIGSDEGMNALVLRNERSGKIDIMFQGSIGTFAGSAKNASEEFKKTRSGKSKNKVDWNGNNYKSIKQTTPSQKEALEFTDEMIRKYGKENIEALIGHSKGGGEALYVASHLDLKAFLVDPAPVYDIGPYVTNGKIIMSMDKRNALLNQAVKAKDGFYISNNRFTTNSRSRDLYSRIPVIVGEGENRNGVQDYHNPSVTSVVQNFIAQKESARTILASSAKKEREKNAEADNKIKENLSTRDIESIKSRKGLEAENVLTISSKKTPSPISGSSSQKSKIR